MGGVVAPWLAELILITIRNTKKGASDNIAGFPLPADYLATFAIFGVLGALPSSASTFAAVTGWGYVVATALNLFDPTLNKAGDANGSGTAASVGGVSTSSTPAKNPNSGTAPAPATIPTQANIA